MHWGCITYHLLCAGLIVLSDDSLLQGPLPRPHQRRSQALSPAGLEM